MARRIIRSARADEDLIEIWLWIARDDPAAADRVLDAIEARWSQLAEHPLSGLARDDIQPGLRHLVAGRYLILYRVDATLVRILRVLHGRRRIAGADVGSGKDHPCCGAPTACWDRRVARRPRLTFRVVFHGC